MGGDKIKIIMGVMMMKCDVQMCLTCVMIYFVGIRTIYERQFQAIVENVSYHRHGATLLNLSMCSL